MTYQKSIYCQVLREIIFSWCRQPFKKKWPIRGCNTEIAISNICERTTYLFSSNIKFETFNFHGCSSKNVFTECLWSWMILTRFVGVIEPKNAFCIHMMLQVELRKILITGKDLDTYHYCTLLTMMLLFLIAIFIIRFKTCLFPWR